MKTARFLLACAVASVLAACGSETITAPVVPPARPHSAIAPDSETSGSVTGGCTLVIVVNPDGSTSEQCVYDSNGQIGTGI